jgi:hypothetical protein
MTLSIPLSAVLQVQIDIQFRSNLDEVGGHIFQVIVARPVAVATIEIALGRVSSSSILIALSPKPLEQIRFEGTTLLPRWTLLSITASLVALLQISNTIIQYLAEVGGASTERLRLLMD